MECGIAGDGAFACPAPGAGTGVARAAVPYAYGRVASASGGRGRSVRPQWAGVPGCAEGMPGTHGAEGVDPLLVRAGRPAAGPSRPGAAAGRGFSQVATGGVGKRPCCQTSKDRAPFLWEHVSSYPAVAAKTG